MATKKAKPKPKPKHGPGSRGPQKRTIAEAERRLKMTQAAKPEASSTAVVRHSETNTHKPERDELAQLSAFPMLTEEGENTLTDSQFLAYIAALLYVQSPGAALTDSIALAQNLIALAEAAAPPPAADAEDYRSS